MIAAPKVSVVIPSYNSAAYLGETIESVLAQQYDDYELIVCDNASSDGTSAVIASKKHPRLDHRRFEEYVGQAANWNRCLDLARGEYVVLLHADDMIAPLFLSRAARILDDHPEVGLVHCAVQHVNQQGQPLLVQQLYSEDRISSGAELFRKLLFEGCVVNPAGVMVRRCVYEQVGRFTEEIVWGVDWHMWLRIALSTGAAYLSAPLSKYRQHPLSGTAGVMATARNGVDERWIVEDIFAHMHATSPDTRVLRSRALRQVAHRTWCSAEEMCRRRAMRPARRGLLNAIRTHPRMLLEPRVAGLWLATFLGYRWFMAFRALRAWILGLPPDNDPHQDLAGGPHGPRPHLL